jgi:hypothetical protein
MYTDSTRMFFRISNWSTTYYNLVQNIDEIETKIIEKQLYLLCFEDWIIILLFEN